jgi:hypothetical protein
VIWLRAVAWLLFTVWAVWLFALQGVVGAETSFARWMPDLGLVLVLSLVAQLEARDAPLLALCAATARVAVSAEPGIALLAGFLGIVGLALLARSVVELTGPVSRALVCGVLVVLFDGWLILVHTVRTPDLTGAAPILLAWPAGITSALLALAAGPFFSRLPGLTPLRRRRW